jgi:hypothetical protein
VEIIQGLGSALGLGFLSGFRLYATVFALGLAIRFQLFSLSSEMAALGVLADWRVLCAAGIACTVEFLADKVPWIDSAWDSIHTFIRPVAAAVLAGTALGEMDPVFRTMLSLLAGGVALTSHSAKAATRLAVNHSPEPFTNVALSVAEDIAAPIGLWFLWMYPLVFLGIVCVFLAVFFALAPRIWRLFRLEMAALGSLLSRWFGEAEPVEAPVPAAVRTHANARRLWSQVRHLIGRAPDFVEPETGARAAIRCAATASLPNLKRSIGYLCFAGGELIFVTFRWFRLRRHSIPLDAILDSRIRRGLLLDQLVISTPVGKMTFDLFKVAPNPAAAEVGVDMAARPA